MMDRIDEMFSEFDAIRLRCVKALMTEYEADAAAIDSSVDFEWYNVINKP